MSPPAWRLPRFTWPKFSHDVSPANPFVAAEYHSLAGNNTAEDPHTWNLYEYARDNPLRYVDPDGHGLVDKAIGVLKQGGNVAIGTYNQVNRAVDRTMGVLPGWVAVPPVPQLEATNQDQREGMSNAQDLLMALPAMGPALGFAAAAEDAEAASGLAAEADAAAAQAARSAAVDAANAAQAGGRTSGTAAGLSVGGRTFSAVSTGAGPHTDLHPLVQQALDSVPQGLRPGFQGCCAEPANISNALKSGVNPYGGTSAAAKIRAPSSAAHATPIPACTSCQWLLKLFGIKEAKQ